MFRFYKWAVYFSIIANIALHSVYALVSQARPSHSAVFSSCRISTRRKGVVHLFGSTINYMTFETSCSQCDIGKLSGARVTSPRVYTHVPLIM